MNDTAMLMQMIKNGDLKASASLNGSGPQYVSTNPNANDYYGALIINRADYSENNNY